MFIPIRNACAALILAGLSSSCVLAIGTGGEDHRAAKTAMKAEAGKSAGAGTVTEAGAGSKETKSAANPEAAAKKAARKAEKKARELTYTRMELALAEMDAELELREATLDLEQARHEQEAAQRELDHFKKAERPLELEDQQMDLDRSAERALEQRQELDELIGMYKKDDFAKLTKELVIQRGRFQMEMAQRDLEHTKKRAADKQDHELAVKERNLVLALKKTEDGVSKAEAKLKKTQAHNELELMRARHKVEDAERPDEDEDEGAGDAKGA